MTSNYDKMIVLRLINDISGAFFNSPETSAQSYNFGVKAPTLSTERTRAVVCGLSNQNGSDEVGALSFKNRPLDCSNNQNGPNQTTVGGGHYG